MNPARAGVVAVVMLIAVPSFAQETAGPAPNPRFEVAFGFQGREPVGSVTSNPEGIVTASVGWASRGPVLSFLVQCDGLGVGNSRHLGTWLSYSLLGGPRLRLRPGARLQPFAQALLGVTGAVGGSHEPSLSQPYRTGPWTLFQVAPSAGLDLQVGRSVTLRLAQVEYRSFMGGERSDRFSVSSGVVFGLGHRAR
jgi:hypothetical protein